jgi:hypothetical protein
MQAEATALLAKLELHRALEDASPGFHIGDDDINVIIDSLKRVVGGHGEGCPAGDFGPCDCSISIYRHDIEVRRADDNGRSCAEFCKTLTQIAGTTTEPAIKRAAETALGMPWLFELPGKPAG